MIVKPQGGYPRSCWNIYDGKPKKQYEKLDEAEAIAQDKEGYQGYFCGFCKHYHIGRLSTKDVHFFDRNPELEIELGTRVVAHMHAGDDAASILRKFRTARDLSFRRKAATIDYEMVKKRRFLP